MSGSARYPSPVRGEGDSAKPSGVRARAGGPGLGHNISDYPETAATATVDGMLEEAREHARKVGIAEGLERAADLVEGWRGRDDARFTIAAAIRAQIPSPDGERDRPRSGQGEGTRP